jgi:hypothetical protein
MFLMDRTKNQTGKGELIEKNPNYVMLVLGNTNRTKSGR